MTISSSDYFAHYYNKAQSVINNRNFFETVFLTSLLGVLGPLFLTGGNSTVHEILSNLAIAVIVFLCIVGIIVLVYLFGELKYKEYRINYMTIVIMDIWEDIKNQPNRPKKYVELAEIIQKRTLFSKRHIMPILKSLIDDLP